MTIFDQENEHTYSCVHFGDHEDFDTPEKKFFDDRQEAADFAQQKNISGVRYIFLAEIGTYRNEAGKLNWDWMYFWWSQPAIFDIAGQLPQSTLLLADHCGFGVPGDRSWNYHVEYKSADPGWKRVR